MRRIDREVTDPKRIFEIINESQVLRVGYYDNGEVYIVPVNFGFVCRDDRYTFYFHGASAGRKYELSKNGRSVGFELEADSKVTVCNDPVCRSSCTYKSVIGKGNISLIADESEKEAALNVIMSRFTGKHSHSFDERTFAAVSVFKLEATSISCKEKTV